MQYALAANKGGLGFCCSSETKPPVPAAGDDGAGKELLGMCLFMAALGQTLVKK